MKKGLKIFQFNSKWRQKSLFLTLVQEEANLLYKELRELSILIDKKEQHVLHTTFHIEEIEQYIKMLLDEFREASKLDNFQRKND